MPARNHEYYLPKDPCDPENKLSWRMDPSDSLSDWKIEIITVSDDDISRKVTTYNVHRCIMAVGSRKSGYFETLFREACNFQENATNTSKIELKQIAADAFPFMLDYVYSNITSQFRVYQHSLTALHFLSQYFDVSNLRRMAWQLIKKDLCLENATQYYKDAVCLGHTKVLDQVEYVCAKSLLRIPLDGEIMHSSTAGFWIRIANKMRNNSKHNNNSSEKEKTSSHLSRIVANGIQVWSYKLTLEDFAALTDPTIMPHIHRDAVFQLLAESNRLNTKTPEDTVLLGEQQLTCLQERCIVSLASSCVENDFFADENDQFASQVLVAAQGTVFMTKLLRACLTSAKSQLDLKEKECSSFKAVYARTNQKLVHAAKALSSSRVELERFRQDNAKLSVELSETQTRLVSAKEDIRQIASKWL